MPDLDLIDRKIAAELMHDATLPIAMIADKVGLSQTPCWKRIQKLEAMGILTGRVALTDPVRPGFGISVFVEIEAVMLALRPPLWLAGAIVAGFALFHGHAHGAEMPEAGSLAP